MGIVRRCLELGLHRALKLILLDFRSTWIDVGKYMQVCHGQIFQDSMQDCRSCLRADSERPKPFRLCFTLQNRGSGIGCEANRHSNFESWRSFKQMRKETLLVFQDFFCSGADPPRPIQAAALVFLTITKSNSVAFVKDEMKATCQIFVICVLYLSKTLLVGSFVSLCPWPLSKHTWLDFLVSNLVLNCAESS